MARINIKLLIIVFMIASVFLISYRRKTYSHYFPKYLKKNIVKYTQYRSQCHCHKSINIFANEYEDESDLEIVSTWNSYPYTVPKSYMRTATCDLYNTLKRGKHQKIISFSLYGREDFYYTQIKGISTKIHELYPGWVLRVYHDSSIKEETKCEVECLANDSGDLIDNVDFCNIESIHGEQNPDFVLNYHRFRHLIYDSSGEPAKTWSADYIHAMFWRWFPIGDHFVDVFLSRDTDSQIFQREVDAVNFWLNANKTAHIMRDNMQHTTEILGGMWGFRNSLNRELADELFLKMIDKSVSKQYNKLKNEKGTDQNFLSQYVYPLVKSTATIHDSYLCKKYEDSIPFPSPREGACFVGLSGPNYCANRTMTECPKECRPKLHQDWITC